MFQHSTHTLFGLLATLVIAAGCGHDEPIETYAVAKEPDPPARPVVSPHHRPPESAAVSLEYDTPEGWEKAKPVMFSKATLSTSEGDEKMLLTVTDMKPAQAELIPNVVRWRRIIGLPPASRDEITKSVTEMKVGENTAEYLELVGPEKSGRREMYIIAMLKAEGKVWIVKLKAEEKLAKKQKDNFEKFVRSMKFKKTD